MTIVYRHGLLRRIVFPFFSAKELLSLMVIEAVALPLSLWLVPKFFVYPLIFGYVGWAGVARRAAPAAMVVPGDPGNREAVTAWLERYGFVRSAGADCWRPPVAKILQWRHSAIRLSEEGSDLRIAGPATYLHDIRDHLQRHKPAAA